jgi:hypothetical protein
LVTCLHLQLQILYQLQQDVGVALDPSLATDEGSENTGGKAGGGIGMRLIFLRRAGPVGGVGRASHSCSRG